MTDYEEIVRLRGILTQQAQEMDILEKEAVSYKRVIESNQKEFSKLEQQLAAMTTEKELQDVRVDALRKYLSEAITRQHNAETKHAQLQATLAAREAEIEAQEAALINYRDMHKMECSKVADLKAERDAAVQEVGRLRRALAILSQLGGTRSEGNMIAQRALDGFEA